MRPDCSATGMNWLGQDEPFSGVLPANQRFDPADLPVGQVDDRLEVQDQLAAAQRPSEVDLGAQSGDGPIPHGVVEEHGFVAATFLRPVHRGVGIAQKRLGVGGERRRDGDADADRRLQLGAAEVDGTPDLDADALGDLPGIVGVVQTVEQHGELVTAEARDGVAGSQQARGVGERPR